MTVLITSLMYTIISNFLLNLKLIPLFHHINFLFTFYSPSLNTRNTNIHLTSFQTGNVEDENDTFLYNNPTFLPPRLYKLSRKLVTGATCLPEDDIKPDKQTLTLPGNYGFNEV